MRRGCGCVIGCLGLVVILGVMLVAFAFITKPGPERRVTSEAMQAPSPGVTLSGAGIVLVEMEEGVLEIEPAEAGAPASATAVHDDETSRLDAALDPGAPWQWRVALKPRRSLASRLLGGEREQSRMLVRLPRDQGAALIVRFSKGECTLRLGGLPLSSVDVDASFGECAVRFDQPLPQPLSTFRLHARMGEFEIFGLGNASPASVDLDSAFGAITTDFGGAWRNGSRIVVRFRLGESHLRIPEGIPFVADHVDVRAGEIDGAPLPAASDAELPPNALRLSVDGHFGSLLVQRPAPVP